ncbi:MAG: nucleotidyltransferase domain-containing protein [Chloroflexi bacterium]|nr:nucleotidyltransferase domain-containing protein [Chloroflexota bacterium]
MVVRVKSPAPTSVDLAQVRAYLSAREKKRIQEQERARQRAREIVRAAARSVIPAFPQVRKAYLFGSAIRPGMLRRDSDIDIAIEGHLTAEDYFALWRELERAIPDRAVEIVELDKDLRFAERVRETGEMIYEAQDSDIESRHRG